MTEVIRVPAEERPAWAKPAAYLVRWSIALILLWWGLDEALSLFHGPRVSLAQACGLVAVPYAVTWIRRQAPNILAP